MHVFGRVKSKSDVGIYKILYYYYIYYIILYVLLCILLEHPSILALCH